MKNWIIALFGLASLACGSSTAPSSIGTFTILNASPAAGGTIPFPAIPGEGTRSPTLEFEFTYPRDLMLGVGQANFELALSLGGTDCMATQIAYSTRLDRNDSVYVANSAARFRTGAWVIRNIAASRCGTSFVTDQVAFQLLDSRHTRSMSWSFAGR